MSKLPEYRYGRTPVDFTVISERAEVPMVCCGYCSAHMAARSATPGLTNRMQVEAHKIRARGGRAHNSGSRASELIKGTLGAVGVTLKSVAIEDIPDRLRKGFAVVAGCQYARLPSYLKVQTNDFTHSVCLYGWVEAEDRAGFYDPLWEQAARGAWVPWAQVRNALMPNGNHMSTTVKVVPVAGDYVIYDAQVQSKKTGKVAPSAPMFNDWRMSQKRGAISSNGTTAQIMGYRSTAYAIQVNTSQGWSDGKSRPTLVFVAQDKVTDIKDSA